MKHPLLTPLFLLGLGLSSQTQAQTPVATPAPSETQKLDPALAALKAAWEHLQTLGVKNLYYIGGDALYGTDTEGATDASHANDLGFMRQADLFEPVLRKALAQ
jgi:hypothetical protein